MNGDGLDDIAFGVQFYSAGQTNEGAVFVFLGFGGTGTGGGSGGSGGADTDADAIPDAGDNCTLVSNTAQFDADHDGCGNACDADFDDSGSSSVGDLHAFGRCVGSRAPSQGGPKTDPTCEESDMNGSGVVNAGDFNLFKAEFGTPPGPGASCNPG